MRDRDPLPDPVTVMGNWAALDVFGRAKKLQGMAPYTMNDVQLSWRSFALMCADPGFLMTMVDPRQ